MEALAVPVARFEPKIEMNPPGATGSGILGAAALTIPAMLTTGAVAFAETTEATVVEPDSNGANEPALTVTFTTPPAISCGNHVPAHCPFPVDCIVTAGSPDEKEATTDPAVSGEPQSSTISTCNGTGRAAVMFEPVLRFEMTGSSWVAVQDAAGGTTSWTDTGYVLPSLLSWNTTEP